MTFPTATMFSLLSALRARRRGCRNTPNHTPKALGGMGVHDEHLHPSVRLG